MLEKQYIEAQDLLNDSFLLGRKVLDSGFRPDFIVGIWRGGTPVGIAVQELFEHHGLVTDHIAIRTSSYEGIELRGKTIRVHGLAYIVEKAEADQSLLIVDDVYDTGLSIQAVIETLSRLSRRNTPRDIRIATVYFKPGNNRTERRPDYYIHETEKWLVFPHELKGLSPEEIALHKPEVARVIREDGGR
ncbi:MAG: hypoxanthine phosphoribosyltransferase [Candidatus Aminicenantes bacterium]|nr:hypoxanthine phosphoribosyltransferase [Candidatus Aminicenantes bacterium]MBM3310444.1 hypoxanthine phosphoribosyltransferase [Candidatus Aminicenantes bacterium]